MTSSSAPLPLLLFQTNKTTFDEGWPVYSREHAFSAISSTTTTTTTTTAAAAATTSTSNEHNSIDFKLMLNHLLDNSVQIHVYACTLLCVMGVIGNFISLLVFFRSSRHSPKITTRHSFILLSLSNLAYLLVFWYYSVMPKMTRHFKLDSWASKLINKLNVIHSSTYMCKSVIYSLNVFIFINALITVCSLLLFH